MRIVCTLLLILSTIPSLYAQEELYNANKLYEEGKYLEALQVYERISDRHPGVGEVYFNMGNITSRNNQLGKSVFYFKKALSLMPRDADVKYNLDYVRKNVVDRVEVQESIMSKISFKKFLNVKEQLYLISLLSILTFTLVLVIHFKKMEIFVFSRNLFAVVLFFVIVIVVKDSLSRKLFGVMTSECSVYSGAAESNTELFKLHEGTELSILSKAPRGWAKIRIADGKRGFISPECFID